MPSFRSRTQNEYHRQEEGLLLQARGSHGRMNVIRLVPPMVSTDAEIDRGLDILRKVLRKASSQAAKAA